MAIPRKFIKLISDSIGNYSIIESSYSYADAPGHSWGYVKLSNGLMCVFGTKYKHDGIFGASGNTNPPTWTSLTPPTSGPISTGYITTGSISAKKCGYKINFGKSFSNNILMCLVKSAYINPIGYTYLSNYGELELVCADRTKSHAIVFVYRISGSDNANNNDRDFCGCQYFAIGY